MPRYKLTIAYDGTDFCGWQKQEPFAPEGGLEAIVRPGTAGELKLEPQGLVQREGEARSRVQMRTVQHVVEQAVREIVREPVQGEGGRRGGWPVSRGVDRLVAAVNGRLPDDALVVGCEAVPDSFDPISDCTS